MVEYRFTANRTVVKLVDGVIVYISSSCIAPFGCYRPRQTCLNCIHKIDF